MQKTEKRIEYIDALRGFTMILVVLGHVSSHSFQLDNTFDKLGVFSFIQLFRMPTFFFISGYIAYKSVCAWEKSYFLNQLVKKLRVQLVPTIVIGLFFTYLFAGADIIAFVTDKFKSGYWFTVSLLEMLLIYYVISFCVNKIVKGSKEKIWTIAIVLSGVVSLVAGVMLVSPTSEAVKTFSDVFCLEQTSHYFQYFIFGLLMAKHKRLFTAVLENKYTMAVIIAALIFLPFVISVYIAPYSETGMWKMVRFALILLGGYLGITVVFNYFRKYQTSFTAESKIGSSLQYIGRRTLDIYMLHYFFLPALPQVGTYFTQNPNMVIELTFSVVLALIIIGFCLILSNVLRTSDLLAHWLFGAKKIGK